MEKTWLHKNNHQTLIVFCNGWGMDERPFHPLAAQNCDVLMISDYREMAPASDVLELTGSYDAVFLIAWSMGVWAGQRIFAGKQEMFKAAIAVNGTLCPIDNRFGIPEEIIAGTLRNFSEGSQAKLYRRMCRDKNGRLSFQKNLPARSLQSQKEELEALLMRCDCLTVGESIYSHIVIADKDLVMPTENQLHFWQSCNIKNIHGCHFPFHLWSSWDRFLFDAIQADIGKTPYRIVEGHS